MIKSKKHCYKGKIIVNIPYKSEPRWFILNEDETEYSKCTYPQSTLREAKEFIDTQIKTLDVD